MLKKLLNYLTPWWSGNGVIDIYDSNGNLIPEIIILPRPKSGEVWSLNGCTFLVGQVEYPYIALYSSAKRKYWYGHIKDAGDIYKVEDTWLMQEVQQQTKTLDEFMKSR